MFHRESGTGKPTPPMQYHPHHHHHPPGRQFYQQQSQQNYLPPWLQFTPVLPSTSSSSMPGHSPSPKAITPNTIKSIHQSILQSLGEDPEDEEYVLGSQEHSGSFVPPLPGPSYSLNFRQKMINRWQEETLNQGGGVSQRCWQQAKLMATNFVQEKPTSKSSDKPTKQIRKAPAKKRAQKMKATATDSTEKVSDGDDATNRIQRRREMNKMAAARCRKRRADRTTELQLEVKRWEAEQIGIQMEIMELQAVQEKLKSVLGSHDCVKENMGSRANSRNGYLANQNHRNPQARPNRINYQGPSQLQNKINMNVREV